MSTAPDFGLAAVMRLPQGSNNPAISGNWLREIVARYDDHDDVFEKAFLEIVLFTRVKDDDVEFTDEAKRYLRELGNLQVIFSFSTDLLPGPYALVGGELRDVWKLIDDSNGTCMATFKPQTR